MSAINIVRIFILALGITIGWVGTDVTRKVIARLDRLEAQPCECRSQEPRLGDLVR